MITNLSQVGYSFDEVRKIWSRPAFVGIPYTDGDEVEQRIARIVSESEDVSVLSDELRRKITDWPSLYHLSRSRANLLRPFEAHLGAGMDVLEVGAGCGAITRFLGECGANILALEGSLRRAEIARSRTRDLQNVTILAEQFEQFEITKKFDVVTLIGVLEYAGVFAGGADPTLAVLRRAKSLLKPQGSLILAIENQLGLKYFAGAPEDHLGVPMYGVEGRYSEGGARTFGRKELNDLLAKSGFGENSCLAAFPDYKLPKSILTERAVANKLFDSSALVVPSILNDPQLPRPLAFAPELATRILARNQLLIDLANSFLVVTGDLRNYLEEAKLLAWYYSTDRRPPFCKETAFRACQQSTIKVTARQLSASNAASQKSDSALEFHIPETSNYIHGHLLSRDFTDLLSKDGWTTKELQHLLRQYLSIVQIKARDKGFELNTSAIDNVVPSWLVDAIPQNIVISEKSEAHLIDLEWKFNEPFSVGFLVFRSMFALVHSMTAFGRPRGQDIADFRTLFGIVFQCLGWKTSEEKLHSFIQLEAELQHLATSSEKTRVASDLDLFSAREMQSFGNVWSEQHALRVSIAGLNEGVAQRDALIAGLNEGVAQRDALIAGLNEGVAQRDARIADLDKSTADINERIIQLSEHLAQAVARIKGFEFAVAGKNKEIEAYVEAISNKDQRIAELESAVCQSRMQANGLRNEVNELRTSTSWRLTAPLRWVVTLVRPTRPSTCCFGRVRPLYKMWMALALVPATVIFYGGIIPLLKRIAHGGGAFEQVLSQQALLSERLLPQRPWFWRCALFSLACARAIGNAHGLSPALAKGFTAFRAQGPAGLRRHLLEVSSLHTHPTSVLAERPLNKVSHDSIPVEITELRYKKITELSRKALRESARSTKQGSLRLRGTKQNPQHDMDRCDVVIPVHDAVEWCAQSIKALLASESRHCIGSIIIVDDGCSDETRDRLRHLQDRDPFIRIIQNNNGRGFASACNSGFRWTTSGSVLLLNSDCFVTPSTIRKLLNAVQEDATIGLACPLSNNAANLSLALQPGMSFIHMDRALETAAKQSAPRSRYPDVCTTVGHCLLVTRRCYEEVGGMDEKWGLGYGEESDLHLRARSRGYLGVAVCDSYVYHFGGGTFRHVGGRQQLQEQNYKEFIRLWGKSFQQYYSLAEPLLNLPSLEKSVSDVLNDSAFDKCDILFVLPGMTQGIGGVHVVIDLCNFLILSGYDARTVICGALPEDALGKYEECLLFKPYHVRNEHELIFGLNVKPAVVVGTLFTTMPAASKLAAKNNSLVVNFVQGNEVYFEDGRHYGPVRRGYELADFCWTTSSWLTAQVKKLNPAANVKQMPIGVDLNLFFPRTKFLQLGQHRLRVTCVIRSSHDKGQFVLREIIEQLLGFPQRFEICVLKPHEYPLNILESNSQQIKAFDLPKSRSFIANLLRESDIFIDASLHEGFGLLPLEAMASGNCVIASDSGGVCDYLVHGENGFVVSQVNKPEVYAKHIVEVAANPKELARLKAAAVNTAKAYSIEKTYQSYADWLSENLRKWAPHKK